MVRHRTLAPLNVYMNGRLVGVLDRKGSGAIDFQYDRSWLNGPDTMAISLSLPLREDRYIGAPVIAVLDNLLPDNDVIRRRLSEVVHAGGIDVFSLLSAVGRDCVGALQFLPDGVEPGIPGVVEGKMLDDSQIASILANLTGDPLGLSRDEDFRISLAGAQEKTALLFWNGHWHKPLGSTATTHILKPPIGRLPNGIDLSDSVENEWICLKLAKELGLPSAEVEMATFEGKKVLVVQRFDRIWTKAHRLLRRPQEDSCQALGVSPAFKYEVDGGPGIVHLLQLLKASNNPEGDQRIFFKSLVFFWLIGATDGHAKNFSIHLTVGGGFRLAPLYDVLSAQPNVNGGQVQKNKLKLAMSVGKNRHTVISTIFPRHFIQTAECAGIDGSLVEDGFRSLLSKASEAVRNVSAGLPTDFPGFIADSILGGFEERLQILRSGFS